TACRRGSSTRSRPRASSGAAAGSTSTPCISSIAPSCSTEAVATPRRKTSMRWLCALVLVAGVAHAECRLSGKPWLESRGRRSADAKLGEAIDVFAVAPGRLDGHAVTFADDGARGHVPFARCRDVEIAWRRVQPRMLHTDTKAPNQDIAVYA